MEMRAYLEGIARRWWLLGLVAILSFWLGGIISTDFLTSQYTASTTVLLNDKILINTAFPSNTVQVDTVTSYSGVVDSPVVLNRITQTYPRLTLAQLQKNVVITLDGTNQVMLINVNDISPFAAADIANYLARHFVNSQTAHLRKQLQYYDQWLGGRITSLDNEINQLNTAIDALIPQRAIHQATPTLTNAQQLTLNEDQAKLDEDTRTRYSYQQTQQEVENTLQIVNKGRAYIILKPALVPTVPNTPPLPTSLVQIIALVVGLFLTIIVIIALDFFTSVVRHRGELVRIVGVPVLAESPQLYNFEQQRLLHAQPPPFLWRIKPLRLLCASVSAIAVKKKGHTVLLTSPHKKRRFAAIMATFMARKGLQTLLIDADFQKPTLHEQIELAGAANIKRVNGQLLPFVSKTKQHDLFLLPATAMMAPNRSMSHTILMEMLPELQEIFDVIIIDAPPMDTSVTHALATKVAQVLLLVKKRRDSLRDVQLTRTACEMLKANTHYVLLT